MNWTIKLVLNIILSPKPINKEYLLPRSLRKNRKDASIFVPVATTHISIINDGLMKMDFIETFVPKLRKKNGERKA